MRSPLFLALILAVPAALAEVAEVDVSLEVGGSYFDTRSDSLFNPGEDVLDLVEGEGAASLRLAPYWNRGDFTLRGELWGQVLYQDGGDADFNGIAQELILDWTASPDWLASAGVQVLHWGPGYIWNPANPFTDPLANNLDRALVYKRDGDAFLSAEWTGEDQAVTLFAFRLEPTDPLYGADPETLGSLAVRWRRFFSSSDLSLFLADRDGEFFTALAGSVTVGDKLELHAEAAYRGRRYTRLPQRVSTPAGDFFTLGAQDRGQNVFQTLIGGQYTFANLTNVIVEYLYNGEGYDDDEYDRLREAARQSEAGLSDPLLGQARGGFLGDASLLTGRLRRHYLFGRVALDQLPHDLDLHFFLLYGLEDDSRIQGAFLRYPLAGQVELRAVLQTFEGPGGSEARLIPFRYQATLGLEIDF